jgi:hypothetical protein
MDEVGGRVIQDHQVHGAPKALLEPIAKVQVQASKCAGRRLAEQHANVHIAGIAGMSSTHTTEQVDGHDVIGQRIEERLQGRDKASVVHRRHYTRHRDGA